MSEKAPRAKKADSGSDSGQLVGFPSVSSVSKRQKPKKNPADASTSGSCGVRKPNSPFMPFFKIAFVIPTNGKPNPHDLGKPAKSAGTQMIKFRFAVTPRVVIYASTPLSPTSKFQDSLQTQNSRCRTGTVNQ